MTDYTHIATIATGVGAVGIGGYLATINVPVGATLVTLGLAILGYKAVKSSAATQPASTEAPA